MIKAESIKKIKEEIEKYNKILGKEVDEVRNLKYRRLKGECELCLSYVEIQLHNFDIFIYGDKEIYKNVFIDRYIKNIPVDLLAHKYNLSCSSIYRMVNKGKEIFEKR